MTNTATSAARLYWQQAKTGQNFCAAANLSFPAAVTVFPEEYLQAPRSWTEKAYHNLIYFNKAEKGGHFAAWEQPQLFSEELRCCVRHAALKPAQRQWPFSSAMASRSARVNRAVAVSVHGALSVGSDGHFGLVSGLEVGEHGLRTGRADDAEVVFA